MPLFIRSVVLAAAITAVAAITPAGASAADLGWRCQAGALSGSVLGIPLDTVSTGALDRECATGTSSLALDLPVPLDATAVVASTMAVDGRALAAGGVTDLRIQALPTLPIALPPVPIPDEYGAVTVPLPSDPLLPLLPASVTVDIRPALNALLPNRQLPTADLLSVRGAVAHADGSCEGATPRLTGRSEVAGISVLGQDLGTNQVVDQTLSLINSGSIDPSDIDLALVQIPTVTGIADSVLRPIVEGALDPLLDTLPTISIPATLANVKVTPGDQTTTDGVLTQHALRIQASIAGVSLADLTVGRASVGEKGVNCAQAAQSPAAAALACTKRKLVLVDVLRRANSVLLVGAADRSLAGRTVNIVFGATGKVVAQAKITSKGTFMTKAPLPASRLSRTNLARYRAVLDQEKSLNLKLDRRMIVHTMEAENGRITIAGRVVLPLAKGRAPILVKRRTSCTKSETVARIRPDRDGRFRVSIKAPEGQVAPVYRLETRVRKNVSNPKTFPTYTLPRAVDLS